MNTKIRTAVRLLSLAVLPIIAIWIPFFYRFEKFIGIPIAQDGMQSVIANYDGPLYIVVAKSFYNLDYIAMIDPDDFVRWIFPHLFYSRIPRYENIAKEYGYTITTDELAQVETEQDFVNLVAMAIERKGH